MSDLKQRPDLLLKVKKHTLAIEFQCSPLNIKSMVDRTRGYKEKHISCLWILGKRHSLKKKLTQQQAQFMRWSNNLGFYLLFLNVAKKQFELYYAIQQADFLNISFQCFYTKNILELKSFMHQNIKINYQELKIEERLLQKRILLRRLNYNKKGYLEILQRRCYQKRYDFLDTFEEAVSHNYYPPIYRNNAFIWKMLVILEDYKTIENIRNDRIQDLFEIPFIKIQEVIKNEIFTFINIIK